MAKVVSPKLKQLIDETIGVIGADSSVFYEYTELVYGSANDVFYKKRKMTQKLLAASKFKIFLFSKSKLNGKHGLEKDFPLLYLEEIGADSQQIFLKFNFPGKNPTFLFIQSERIDLFLSEVQKHYNCITYGWPTEVRMQITSKDVKPLPSDPDYDPGHCHGLIHCYYAFCNLRGTSEKPDLVQLLKDCDERKCVDLDLSECPGIEGRSELALDILTLGYALRYNTYFKSITFRNVENKELYQALARLLRGNTTITRLVCSGSNIEVYDRFGDFIRSNNNHKLQVLQFTDSKFSNRAALGFARALCSFTHVLRVLDLQNCNIQGSGIIALVNSLRANMGFSLGIEELNLSHNLFNSTAAASFLSWVKDIRKYGYLQRLAIVNTGISVGPLVLELNLLPVRYLDVSDCKFDKYTMDNISHFAETTKTIQTLRLANCGIFPETLVKAMRSLFGNENLKELHLDISRNSLGPKGVSLLLPVFRLAHNLVDLDVSDNAIKEKCLVSLVNVLPCGIQRLNLNYNFSDKAGGTVEADELAQSLSSLISSRPNMYHLSVAGCPTGRIGKSLSVLFANLANNFTLEELDISDNQIGEAAFSQLASCISTNVGLKALRCDLNGLGYQAYQCLRRSLDHNKHLCYVEWPTFDFDQQPGRTGSYKFRKILCEIYSICESRRISNSTAPSMTSSLSPLPSQSKIESQGWFDPFSFDTKWDNPSDVVKRLFEVPPELQGIAKTLEELGVEVSNENVDAVFDDDLFTPPLSPRQSSSSISLPKTQSLPDLSSSSIDNDSPRTEEERIRRHSIEKRPPRSHSKKRTTRIFISKTISENDEEVNNSNSNSNNNNNVGVDVPPPDYIPTPPVVPPPQDEPQPPMMSPIISRTSLSCSLSTLSPPVLPSSSSGSGGSQDASTSCHSSSSAFTPGHINSSSKIKIPETPLSPYTVSLNSENEATGETSTATIASPSTSTAVAPTPRNTMVDTDSGDPPAPVDLPPTPLVDSTNMTLRSACLSILAKERLSTLTTTICSVKEQDEVEGEGEGRGEEEHSEESNNVINNENVVHGD